MLVRHGFWCCLTFATIWACSPTSGPGAAAPDAPAKPRAARPERPPVTTHLPSGSVGPYLMPAPNGWVAAWASPLGEELNWHAATFGQDGAPSATPRRLMAAPAGLTTMRLRAINPQRGLVVAAFESEDSETDEPSYGLSTLVVSSAGSLLAGNATLVEECDPIVWIDVIPLGESAFVAWAEDLGDHAELFAAVVNLDGHRQTDVIPLHDQARAWQLVRHPRGAMLGVVTSDSNVDFVAINAKGEAGKRQNLLDDHTAESDIDLAATGDRVLVAFSNRRGVEPQLHSAWISLDGTLQSNVQAMTKPYGASALIGLRSTPTGPVLLWQNTSQEPELVRIGRVSGEGRLTDASLTFALPKTDAQHHDLLVPQMESTATGVVVMQPPCIGTRDCKKHADALELGSELKPHTRLQWSQRASADLVWDFQCGPANCAALAANFGSRTQIQLLTTAAATRTPLASHKTATSPQPSVSGAIRAVVGTQELAALEAVHVGSNQVIATLTAFDPNTPYEVPATPAPDGRLAPVQAQLTTHVVGTADASGSSAGSVSDTAISIRARSVAGIDITGAGTEALVVWTAIDNQKPQVFLTSIDGRGIKLRQAMLTRQSGEVLALGAATAKDKSYYVGWVREEGKSNKAYAAHVNPNLTRQSADTVIAETSGTISDVDLVVTQTAVWAVVAQSNEGTETLKWLRLNAATLQPFKGPVTDPTAVADASTNGLARFAPRLTRWNDGMVLAWLEQGPAGATARLVHLDAKGEVLRRFDAAVPGEPATLNLDCNVDCRIAVTGELDSAQGYVALSHLPANTPEQFTLTAEVVTRRLSPASSQIRAAVSLTDVYYFDAEPGAERGVVHAVEWTPTP